MAYDVIVLGAGVIGCSVAYHLATLGAGHIGVLERAPSLGSGSTGKATGGFRCQYSTAINVRLSLMAREKLLRFREETGVDPEYRPYGYLFVASTESQIQTLRDALAVQHEAGLPESRAVDIEEIRTLNPALYTDDLIGGTFCPLDGFMRPIKILQGYYEAARRLGVAFRFGVGQAQVWREGDRVRGVVLPDGERIEAGAVVNAAGAWAGIVAQQAGVNLPVQPLKRQVAITYPFAELPETMPMSVDVNDGFHLRVRDGRVLLLYPHAVHNEQTFETDFERAWLDAVQQRARHRVPCLRNARIDIENCWAGLYEMSPDKHVILGEAAELSGFYLVNGSSGHGVMHSPALGELLARLILRMELPFDITPLRPTRFAEGALNRDTGVL
ncbi:MAG: FAD-dependent oxidoreductase [Fimbriimonadales bacterium]|nr:MAG: FAD-dependent oxidoreductase [Fimbriimonadales bacterium]